MTTQTKPEPKKPTHLDVKTAKTIVKKVVRENKEWFKEMADK